MKNATKNQPKYLIISLSLSLSNATFTDFGPFVGPNGI